MVSQTITETMSIHFQLVFLSFVVYRIRQAPHLQYWTIMWQGSFLLFRFFSHWIFLYFIPTFSHIYTSQLNHLIHILPTTCQVQALLEIMTAIAPGSAPIEAAKTILKRAAEQWPMCSYVHRSVLHFHFQNDDIFPEKDEKSLSSICGISGFPTPKS